MSFGRGNEKFPWLLGHMAKMAATHIYGKTFSKIYFSETARPISTKLGYVALGTLAHYGLFK